jgi:hypothetical protein
MATRVDFGKTPPWHRKVVSTWQQYQEVIEPYLDGDHLFRGVESEKYELVTSVGRGEPFAYSPEVEAELFDQFRREALPLLPSRPQDEWEWLALAQHFGTPTRLLDWSESPYVALFFAVLRQDDVHGSLYVIPRPDHVPLDTKATPFDLDKVSFFYPGYVTSRLVSQRGLFTVHPDPEQPYTHPDMLQIVIDSSCKRDFRCKLDTVGVHQAAIFADLDGLSRRLIALRGYRAKPVDPAALALAQLKASIPSIPPAKVNPHDPQKGQWGGLTTRNGWRLTGEVAMISEGWYGITLTVEAAPGERKALVGTVTFHLHNSFRKPVRKRQASEGRAVLELEAYGAFTVGVHIAADDTLLELDLAELEDAPKRFRER